MRKHHIKKTAETPEELANITNIAAQVIMESAMAPVRGPSAPTAPEEKMSAEDFDYEELKERASKWSKVTLKLQTNHTLAAIASGLLLDQVRREMLGRSGQHNQFTGKRECFTTYMEENGIPETTAYRWMDVADRVLHMVLRIPAAFPLPKQVPKTDTELYMCLTCDKQLLSDETLAVREQVEIFTRDKTLTEAIDQSIAGTSHPRRIANVINGKTKGGANPNRKNFPYYIGRKWNEILAYIGVRPAGKDGRSFKGGRWAAMKSEERFEVMKFSELYLQGLPDDLLDYEVKKGSEILASRKKKGGIADLTRLANALSEATKGGR